VTHFRPIFQEKYKSEEVRIKDLISHKELEMEYFDEFDQPDPNVLNVVSNAETLLAPYFFYLVQTFLKNKKV